MECTKRKVILTGATGAIGYAVIQKCIERQWEVYALVRPGSERNKRIPLKGNIHIIECDLSDIDKLCKLKECQGADYFLHLGWSGTFGNARNDVNLQMLNVQYAKNACITAAELGCSVFLFAGSQAEFGRVEGVLNGSVLPNPETAYGTAKLQAGCETAMLCKQYNLRHLYFRILSVYGPADGEKTMIMSTIRQLLNGMSPKFTPGEQLWDYLYSEDAANALLLACEKGKSDTIYCLGSGKAKPLKDYIRTIGSIVNADIALGIGAIPYGERQVMHLCADISPLEEDFGFCPEVDFAEGIQRTVQYIKNEVEFE